MGIIGALLLGKKLLTPDAKMEMELLQKQWDKADKEFRDHIDNCQTLPKYPQERCDECLDVAIKTGKITLLNIIRDEFRRQNTPSFEGLYSEEQIIEAALKEWAQDPTRPIAHHASLAEGYQHTYVHVYVEDEYSKALGLMKVSDGSEGPYAEFEMALQ